MRRTRERSTRGSAAEAVHAARYILGASERPVVVTRIANDAITPEPDGGYLREHWSQLIRDPRERFAVGTRIAVAQGSVQVLSVTADGRPAVIEVEQKAHQKHLEWSPSRIVSWASTVGLQTAKLCEAILSERRHPEQGYRSCLGILRLGKIAIARTR